MRLCEIFRNKAFTIPLRKIIIYSIKELTTNDKNNNNIVYYYYILEITFMYLLSREDLQYDTHDRLL